MPLPLAMKVLSAVRSAEETYEFEVPESKISPEADGSPMLEDLKMVLQTVGFVVRSVQVYLVSSEELPNSMKEVVEEEVRCKMN